MRVLDRLELTVMHKDISASSLTVLQPPRDNEDRRRRFTFAFRHNLVSLAGVTQLVECDLAKVDVAGSNPVSRSISSGNI